MKTYGMNRKFLRKFWKNIKYVAIWKYFISSVEIDSNGCWVWNDLHCAQGYGKIRFWFAKLVGNYKAHRLSFRMFKGKIKEGYLICHHCDNPPCVNPAHLYQGTHTDNNRDTVKRNRRKDKYGDEHHSYLHPELCATKAKGNHGSVTHPESFSSLITKDGRNRCEIMKKCAARGEKNGLRKHPEKIAKGSKVGSSKMTEQKILKMRKMYETGEYTHQKLADIFGIFRGNAQKIINRVTWRSI